MPLPHTHTHYPSLPILLWTIFLPLPTLWDTSYIFLRPHSFPNEAYHTPFFQPMQQWASIDHLYGPQAWTEHEGFTAAQGVVNVVEAALCAGYVWIVWRGGGLGESWMGKKRVEDGKRKIVGRMAARAVVLGLAAGLVTGTKTFLYFSREVFSGYKYTGHIETHPLFTLWGFMNGLYFVASGYMIYSFSREILDALSSDGEERSKRE